MELGRLFARDLARWRQQVEAFPDTASLWRTAGGFTNPAGTLALHVEGNLREYVGRQLGRIPYARNRDLEFRARDVERPEILDRLTSLAEAIPAVVAALTPAQLDADFPEPYDGLTLSARQFLVHLFGHANYHLGQVDALRRVVTGNGALKLAGL